MKRCFIQNLGLIVTNQCNLDCAHCLRGEKNSEVMSNEVIDGCFGHLTSVGNLAICGGEPTLALDRIEKIFDTIVQQHIVLDTFSITINGTIYSPELLRILDEVAKYIGGDNLPVLLDISIDKYHLDEVSRLGIREEFIDNLKRYRHNKYFSHFRDLQPKIFREGNAEHLDSKFTVPLRPMDLFVTYIGKNKKYNRDDGICNIGPMMAVNPQGTITECDASIKHQDEFYHYGNVFDDSFEEIALKRGILLERPKQFIRKTHHAVSYYQTYHK